MSIVILGAAGQLGRQLCRFVPDSLGLDRAHVDLLQPGVLRQTLQALEPRVVFNAAGFTDVDVAESTPDAAFAVNAFALRDLAHICRDLGALLIHFSTNYVFGLDRRRDTPYDEDDAPGPLNVYGASKLAGEHFVRAICPRHFIVRTAGLYGPPGPGRASFVERMLRKACAGETLRVVEDQICTPTSAVDLARAVAVLIESDAYGVYHITNGGACSWHEFAQTIVGPSVEVIATKTDETPGAAERPRFSVLSNMRWLNAGSAPLRDWRVALAEHLAERK